MRFLDTNILIYAFLETKRALSKKSQEMKSSSRNILKRIEEGEQVMTTLIHFSEMINILQDNMPKEKTNQIIERILDNENFILLEVDRNHYQTSLELNKELNIGLNDALAVTLMRILGILEIYSYDKHFDNIKMVKRITA